MQVDLEVALQTLAPLPGVAVGVQYITLSDDMGNLFNFYVDDTGILSQVPASPGDVAQHIVLKDLTLNTLYLLSVGTNMMTTTPLASFEPWQSQILLISNPSGFQSRLFIADQMLNVDQPVAVVGQPQAILRWSDDSTKSWSFEHIQSTGGLGEYQKRVIWRRLGRSRDRIYELTVSDRIPWRIADAYLNATPGFGPVERLIKAQGKMT